MWKEISKNKCGRHEKTSGKIRRIDYWQVNINGDNAMQIWRDNFSFWEQWRDNFVNDVK